MTFVPRKVWEPGGFGYLLTDGKCQPLAPHVAGIETNRFGERREVPWTELMERKRARQRERLQRIRWFDPEPQIVPCYVWTFFNRQMIPYHGWYCYVVSRYFELAVNFRDFRTDLAESITQAIPLGLLPGKEFFTLWMERFAQEYPRRTPIDKRKAGSKVGWITKRSVFTIERPAQQQETREEEWLESDPTPTRSRSAAQSATSNATPRRQTA
jgi:hypothetical protein